MIALDPSGSSSAQNTTFLPKISIQRLESHVDLRAEIALLDTYHVIQLVCACQITHTRVVCDGGIICIRLYAQK